MPRIGAHRAVRIFLIMLAPFPTGGGDYRKVSLIMPIQAI